MAGLGQFSFPACGLGWAGVEQGSHYRVSSAGGVAACQVFSYPGSNTASHPANTHRQPFHNEEWRVF